MALNVSVTISGTDEDAAIAKALTDAYNTRQKEADAAWVNITVKQYVSRFVFKPAWRDTAMRYLRTKQDAESRAELARLESETSVA